jgi:cellulose biosynthesis protein BcsQ
VAGVKIIQEQQSLNRLRKVLRSSKIAFDYVLIDTPPTLDVMTAISMVAADEVLVPAQCHYFAMVGIRAIKDSMHRIRDAMRNPELKFRGVLPTMLDTHSTRSQTVLHEMRAVLGREVLNTVIPYDVTVMDAPHRGKPVVEDAPESPAGKAYRALVDELLEAYLSETPIPSLQSVEGTPVISSSDGLAANAEATASDDTGEVVIEEDTATSPVEASAIAEVSETTEASSVEGEPKAD